MKKILTFKRNNDKLNVLTNMDNIRPIWKIYDQFGQFKSNKGQYVMDNSPWAIDAKSWRNDWRSSIIFRQILTTLEFRPIWSRQI